jgi:hypothetical protein
VVVVTMLQAAFRGHIARRAAHRRAHAAVQRVLEEKRSDTLFARQFCGHCHRTPEGADNQEQLQLSVLATFTAGQDIASPLPWLCPHCEMYGLCVNCVSGPWVKWHNQSEHAALKLPPPSKMEMSHRVLEWSTSKGSQP